MSPSDSHDRVIVRHPRDLLASIPFALGFRPRSSLVLVGICQNRPGPIARVDLSDVCGGGGAVIAKEIEQTLRRAQCTSIFPVLYDVDEFAQTHGSSHARRCGLLLEALDQVAPVLPAWTVTTRGYRALGCRDLDCCPLQGRPLHELESSPVAASFVLRGHTVEEQRSHALDLPQVDQWRKDDALAAIHRWERRKARISPSRWRGSALLRWRRIVDRAQHTGEIHPDSCGFLSVTLREGIIRDAFWLESVSRTSGIALSLLRDPQSHSASDAMRTVLTRRGLSMEEYDRGRLALRVMITASAHVPPHEASDILAMCGALAWWIGQCPQAGAFAKRALDMSPGNILASLIVRLAADTRWLPSPEVA